MIGGEPYTLGLFDTAGMDGPSPCFAQVHVPTAMDSVCSIDLVAFDVEV